MRRLLREDATQSMIFDCSQYETFVVDLGTDIEQIQAVNVSPGKLYVFVMVQDSNGSHQVDWGSRLRNAVALNTEAEAITVQCFVGIKGGLLQAVPPGTWVRTSGALGPQGPPGLSAYEIAVYQGFIGSVDDWLESLIGPEGPEGPQGPQGLPGLPGSGGGAGSNLVARTASELGCVLDCDLATGNKIGGGTATDNTAIINAFFAGASIASPRRLIIDGASLISGILIPANGCCSIVGQGWATGFFVKTGAFANAILVGPEVDGDPGPPAPVMAAYAVAFEDFMINGNRGTGYNGNSTGGNPRGGRDDPANGYPWIFGIDIANCIHIHINHIRFYEIPTYNIRLNNCVNVVIENCRFENPNMQFNTDNIHVNGSCSDIRISKCWFQGGDDAIALNSPEGFSGNIERVVINSCIFFDVFTCVRCFSTRSSPIFLQNRVYNIAVSNCVANKVNSVAFWLAAEGIASPLSDAIRDFSISNFVATGAGAFIALGDNIGSLKVNNCTYNNPNSGAPFIWFPYGGTYTISSCDISRCSIYKDSERANNFMVGSQSTFRFKQLRIDGFAYDFPAALSLNPMSMFNFQGTITNLILDAVDTTNITSFGTANTSALTGAGVLGSGWLLPDTRMADNTIYLSSSQNNQLVAKVAGTVYPLTGGGVVIPPPVTQNPTDFWIMQEGSGTTLANTYNPTNVLTTSGGVSWQTLISIPGVTSLVLDGTGICTAASNASTSLDGSTPFSITAFVLLTGATVNDGLNKCIISNLDLANNNRGFYLVIYQLQMQFYLVSNLSTNDYIQVGTLGGSYDLQANQVTHVAITYDGSKSASGVQLYVRGLPAPYSITQDSLTGSTAPTPVATVGALPGPTAGVVGVLFEVGLWPRVLSAQEIASMAGL